MSPFPGLSDVNIVGSGALERMINDEVIRNSYLIKENSDKILGVGIDFSPVSRDSSDSICQVNIDSVDRR